MRLRPAQIVSLVGVVLLVVSGTRKWLDGNPGITGFNVPAKFLVDVEVVQEGASIGALLVVIALVGAVGALVPQLRLLTVLAGLAALVAVGLFEYQLGDFADLARQDPFAGDDLGRTDLTGIGVYVAGAGGLALVAGALLTRPVRST